MFARKVAARREAGDGLFTRVGDLLQAQGLTPDPANYAFAYHLLTRDDEEARRLVAQLIVDGVRLSGKDIAAVGSAIVAGPVADPLAGQSPPPAEPARDAAADRLVAQTAVQVEAMATMMRMMHHETVDFGRDLAQSAAAFDGGGIAGLDVARLTNAMIARVAQAEARLEQAAAETETLRAELAEAQATARRDPLTGLPNRRAFEEAFARPAGPAGRCLALCDIDSFKRINDGFGHAVGDRVLGAVARILADACEDHLVSRLGGEEFAVLVGDGDLAAATALLDEARETVGARRFRTRDQDTALGRVTFSAGVVAVTPGETADAALARADRLLYRAKAAGRDQVIAD